jgi:signal transduction histidine kinase
LGDEEVVGALVIVGEARDPFTVLDNRFLLAFGQQVGAALANADLHRDLQVRTEELERLQARMVHQHEEERNRLWRELHDETAQVLAALNLQRV